MRAYGASKCSLDGKEKIKDVGRLWAAPSQYPQARWVSRCLILWASNKNCNKNRHCTELTYNHAIWDAGPVEVCLKIGRIWRNKVDEKIRNMLEVVAAKRWRFPLVLKSWKNLRVQVSSISDASMVYYQLFVLFGLNLPNTFGCHGNSMEFLYTSSSWSIGFSLKNGVSTQLHTEVPALQLSHPPIVALPTHPMSDCKWTMAASAERAEFLPLGSMKNQCSSRCW